MTGASSGIGEALSKVLALEEGYAVALVARRRDRLEGVAAAIRDAGGTVAAETADVRDRDGLHAAVRRLEAALGPVDLLVANAGISLETNALAPRAPALEAEMAVNFLGAFYAIEAVLPSMRERGRGHVVAIASLAAWRGFPGAGGYCASKAALLRLMESMRPEWRKAGIRATTVLPGFVESEITARQRHPMPFLMSAERAARKIARAVRRKKKVYAFPWPTVLLARLGRVVPDWALARVDGRGRPA